MVQLTLTLKMTTFGSSPLKDGNFDIPAKKKTDKTHLSLTTVKRPEMKDVLKETGKLIKGNICFDK